MRSLFLFVCLLFAATVTVQADEDECKCLKVLTGDWKIKFAEDDLPFSNEGTMSLEHDFDELYHGKVYLTRFGVPRNLEIMGFLNATSCVFRGSMANVLQRITIPFKWDIKNDGAKMSGTYILRNQGVVSEKFGSVVATYKVTQSKNEAQQSSNGFGFFKKCDGHPKSTLLTT